MDVPIITMDVEEAKKRLKEYQRHLHKSADEEYEAAAAGYKAMAAGKALVNLSEAIRAGGFDDQMRPRLAVGRADRSQVYFRWRARETVGSFSTHKEAKWTGRFNESLVTYIDFQKEHGQFKIDSDKRNNYMKTVEGWALVPMVPADARPCRASGLKRFHVLWEVEQWSDRKIGATPDIDPYLLQHLHGDLYVVIAEWDLTPLERAVMSVRADR